MRLPATIEPMATGPAPPSNPRQLPLALAAAPRFGMEDFIVGTANAAAHDLVLAWPDWPGPVVLLIGPEGAGKSHLAAIWAAAAAATILPAGDLATIDPVALAARGGVAVEDAGPGLDEPALFHLLNAAREAGSPVLITARAEPVAWGLGLPDLVSRLRAATPVRLEEPDDALLEAVIGKLFADRQTMVDPQVVRFLARRIERSYGAAVRTVERIDREALAAKAAITRPLAARLIADAWSREPHLPGLEETEPDEHNPS